MLVSELIDRLIFYKNQHGDRYVMYRDGENGLQNVEDVDSRINYTGHTVIYIGD